jgi:hypothetical protein
MEPVSRGRFYPVICMDGLRKTKEPQHSRSPGRQLNPGHPKYETVLTATFDISLY